MPVIFQGTYRSIRGFQILLVTYIGQGNLEQSYNIRIEALLFDICLNLAKDIIIVWVLAAICSLGCDMPQWGEGNV